MTQTLAILLLTLPLGGCSDDGGGNGVTDTGADAQADLVADTQPDTQPDTLPDTGGPPAGCWTSDTRTNFVVEAADDDFADCINGCANDDLAVWNFASFQNAGWRAQIDGNDHAYASQSLTEGPDLDLYGVIVPGRTILTLYVEPVAGSQINAVITTHDGFNAMTFNADAEADSPWARTQVAAPHATDLPFYFFVEHFPNYSNFPSTSFDYQGGNHGYIVRYETSAFAPVELGELGASTPTLSGSGELDCYGDTDYFRFTGSAAFTVTVTRTGDAAMVPYIAGMDTTGGQLTWVGRNFDGSPSDTGADGVVNLTNTGFRGSAEYIFAVTDWSGAAGPGAFTYDVTVTAN